MEQRELLFPHENLQAESKISLVDRFRFYVSALRPSISLFLKRNYDPINEFINGKENGNLHHKYSFVEIMRELGFRTPRQELYDPEDALALKITLQFFETQNRKVLCKPQDGTKGRGIIVISDQEELIDFLLAQEAPYILQEHLPPQKDFRYILHREGKKVYRVCYEKRRANVVGDGESTLFSLILKYPDVPSLSKKTRLVRKNLRRLFDVPTDKEVIELVNSGNISQGAYGVLTEGVELENIDAVVLEAIEKLETEKRIRLSTYCFDLGSLSELDEGLDSNKKNLVFYELQMPFKFTGYVDAPEVVKNKRRICLLLLRSVQKSWLDRK